MSELDHQDELTSEMFRASIDLIRRTGARQIQIRWSDDETPVIWFVVAVYDENRWEVSASNTPQSAATRLLEKLVDGAKCAHCHRPTGFEPKAIHAMPMSDLICWYQWDPELKVYRRGCE